MQLTAGLRHLSVHRTLRGGDMRAFELIE